MYMSMKLVQLPDLIATMLVQRCRTALSSNNCQLCRDIINIVRAATEQRRHKE